MGSYIKEDSLLEHVAEQFGIPFHHFPITKENKAEQERETLELLKDAEIDLVVRGREDRGDAGVGLRTHRSRAARSTWTPRRRLNPPPGGPAPWPDHASPLTS